MNITCKRKEDDSYYQGAFWIIGDNVKEIKRGNFTIDGIKLLSNYEGEYLEKIPSKTGLTHKKLWERQFSKKYTDVPWNYYPRGRVSVYNGTAFINLHSLFNQPSVVNAVVRMYHLEKLEIEVDLKDTYQGSHYDFLLR